MEKFEDKNEAKMPLSKYNYILIGIGALIIIVGMLLMLGGTPATPETFSDDIFSWRRISLAPVVIVLGFAFEVYAIIKRF